MDQAQIESNKSDKYPLFSNLIFKIQNKIPNVNIDALTLLYQFLMLEVAVASMTMWIIEWSINGSPDVTIHWWFYENHWATQDMPMYMGIGIHWTTLFFYAFGSLNLSIYLRKRLKVIGVHNIAYSLIIGYWVSAMVFEIPYVFMMDWFHNFNEVTRFPIWLSGWNTIKLGATGMAGTEAPKWILVSLILYPMTVASSVILYLSKHGNYFLQKYGFSKTKQIFYTAMFGSLGVSALIVLWFDLEVGIFPVIIRNFGWFFGIILAYIFLLDAVKNPSSPSYIKEEIKIRFHFDRKALFIFSLFILGYVIWILYPITPLNSIYPAQLVKGYWFPQTVYAFYQSDLPIINNQIWVGNVGVWFMNHMIVKLLATLFTIYALAPRIKYAKLGEDK